MRHFKKVLFILSSLMLARSGGAVSRVGGGVGSMESEFHMQIPSLFNNFGPSESGQVVLQGPLAFKNNFVQPLKIQVAEAPDLLPELKSLSRDQVKAYANAHGWVLMKEQGCILVYKNNAPTAQAMIGVWGSEKGFVAIGDQGDLVEKNLEEMAQSLQVNPGACGWK